MWGRAIVLLGVFGMIQGWKTFEVPQKVGTPAKRHVVSYFPQAKSGKGATEAVGRSGVVQILETLQASSPLPLSSLHLDLDPGPSFLFGLQELCIAVSKLFSLRYTGPGLLTIDSVSFSDSQFELSLQDEAKWPRVIHSWESLPLKVTLFPGVLGKVTAKALFVTSEGVGRAEAWAEVEESRYRLGPVEVAEGEEREVLLYNPHTSPLRVIDAFLLPSSEHFHLLKPSAYTHSWVIAPGSSSSLLSLTASDPGSESPISLGLITSTQRLHIPLNYRKKEKWWRVSPEKVDFGIVAVQKLQHAAKLEITNYEDIPLEITQLISSSILVSYKQLITVVPAHSLCLLFAELQFSPKSDGFISGELTIITNSTQTSLLIPFSGYALFSLIQYDPLSLVFSYTDTTARNLSMAVDGLSRLRIVSFGVESPAFIISPLFDTLQLEHYSQFLFHLDVNQAIEPLGSSFLRLETDVGIIGIPITVDDGIYSCEYSGSSGRATCEPSNLVDYGQLPAAEPRQLILRIKNEGYFPVRVFVRRPYSPHSLHVATIHPSVSKDHLLTEDGHPAKFIVVGPGQVLTLECELIAAEGRSEARLQVHIGLNVIEFDLRWEFVPGKIVVNPLDIHLEHAFFGYIFTIPIIVEHSYPKMLQINSTSTRMEGLHAQRLLPSIVSNTPSRVWDVHYPHFPSHRRPASFNSPVSLSEVKQWRSRLKNNTISPSGSIWLKTEFSHSIPISFSASFRPPMMAVNSLDFGIVGIREPRPRFIRVYNPADDYIHVQLLLLRGKICKDCDVGSEFAQATFSPIHDRFIDLSPFQKTRKLNEKGNHRQHFFLSPSVQHIFVIPPKDSLLLGPLIMYPQDTERLNFTLYIRNNLTVFETVELVGTAGYSELIVSGLTSFQGEFYPFQSWHIDVDLAYELQFVGNDTLGGVFYRAYRILNRGNKAACVTDVAFDGQFCSLHNIEILNCHEEYFLPPDAAFDVHFIIRPDFHQEVWREELWIVAGDEVFLFPVTIKLPIEELELGRTLGPPDNTAWTICGLFAASFGTISGLIVDICGQKRTRKPGRITEKAQFLPAISPLLPYSDKKKPKRHRKKKPILAFTLDLTDAQPVSQETATSSKEEPIPNLAWNEHPVVIEKPHNTEELNEESLIEESDEESFLDDYRERSGLFMGFRALQEEL